jgi:hypothetical protein
MSVTEVLQSLGSWSVQLRDDVPDEILKKLGYFGHIVIHRGDVDPEQTAGATLLSKARYVGVLIDKDQRGRQLSGDSLVRWLGDEDKKGAWLSSKVALTNGSLTAWLTALLPASIGLGSIYDPGGSFTSSYQYVTRREAIESVCDAFNVQFRINGNATLDAGTQAQLYSVVPDTIIAAKASLGADLDLTSLGGQFDVGQTVRDYSTDVFLLGTTQDNGTVVNATATAPTFPYSDLRGNPVRVIRPISESGETAGTATARAQLQLNRFNRLVTSVKVTAADYEWRGSFVVGDNAYAYDLDNGIYDTSKEVVFRGEIIHPTVIQITGHTWQITDAFTVLFRTQTGEFIDLTRYVDFDSGSDEITIGDVPKSLTSSGNPVLDRSQSAPDASIPNPPTALGLVTSSTISSKGENIASVTASWTAPTQNTDGSVITDLSHYLVQWRPQFRAPQWNGVLATTTTIEIPNLTVGLIYDVEVATVDLAGHISAFTSVSSITAAPDTTGPNPPADPVVGSYLGQLRIEYAGTDNLGQPMPSDANRVDVHVSATSGFTPDVSNRVSSLTPFAKGVAYADAPYGATRYVKLVAYDHNRNPSTPSGQVSGSTVRVADGDIQTLSVGKLIAGTMSADVVMAGRFATALTGARREINAVGFQGWDASNNLTISLDGVNNLLTGVFQTALSGRRITLGAGGNVGEIDFAAPDGTKTFMRAWTEPGGVEAIQFGVAGTGGDVSLPNNLWNRINYNNDSGGYANYRANKHEFMFGDSNGVLNDADGGFFHVYQVPTTAGTGGIERFMLDSTGGSMRHRGSAGTLLLESSDSHFVVWGTAGTSQPRLEMSASDGYLIHGSNLADSYQEYQANGQALFNMASTNGSVLIKPNGSNDPSISPLIQLATENGASLSWRTLFDGTNQWLEAVVFTQASYAAVRGASFTSVSDASTKTDIADTRVDALAELRATRIVDFRRKPLPKMRRVKKEIDGRQIDVDEIDDSYTSPTMPIELGVTAQESPASIVRPMANGLLGIDLTAQGALNMRAIQQLADLYDSLADRLNALDNKGGRKK